MEVENKLPHYLRSWWVSAENSYNTAQLWWASMIERLDQRFRVPMLVLGDVTGWAMLLLGGIALVILVALCFLLVFVVLVFPFYYLTLYLGTKYLLNKATLFYGLMVLGLSNAALYGLWWLPESAVLKSKYGIDNNFSPETLMERFQIVSVLFLWLGGSVYVAVFCLDLLVILAGIYISAYYALHSCYSSLLFLVHTVPWYALLPIIVCPPLTVISVYRRMTSDWGRKEMWEKQKVEDCSDFQVAPIRLPV